MEICIIGLDLAKSVFQVHGTDAEGRVLLRRQLRRGEVVKFFATLPPCVVGMEACATSHHWARMVADFGHEVRLLPPAQVKPYVKRGKKNDAADAAAIAEAMTRPHMRFVPVKTISQQSMLMLHRSRELLVRQRTMLINALCAHLAEFGLVAGPGRNKITALVAMINDDEVGLPAAARMALGAIAEQIYGADQRIAVLEKQILADHRVCESSRNLATIPGIGPITASAIAASVPDPSAFKSGRHFAAWLGLVPRQNSSGGKDRLGRITKMGDAYIRRLLVIGATGQVRHVGKRKPTDWLAGLLARKPVRVASVALANKMARMAWAILSRGEVYREAWPLQPA